MGELAGRLVQCVGWQVRQQVARPGGLDRGVGVGRLGRQGRTDRNPGRASTAAAAGYLGQLRG